MVHRQLSKSFEQLEQRHLMAALWQNSANALDVDRSGLVIPLDVLLVANDINQNGLRVLPTSKPADYTGPLCDTNGDGIMSGLDALLIVNAINQFPDAPTLEVALTPESDRNGDQVVLIPDVVYSGQSRPNVRVQIDRIDGDQASLLEASVAGDDGRFQLSVQLNQPLTHLRFTVSDPRGRSLSTERVVRLGDAVTSFSAVMLETIRHATDPSSTIPGLMIKPPPPMVARTLAMMHGAMFEAINAIDQQFVGYLLNGPPQAGVSPAAAAATAAHRVASALFSAPEQLELWDETLAEIMNTIADGPAKSAGVNLGQTAASAMLSNRASDGSDAPSSYTPGTLPGQWRPTAPDFTRATLPQWPGVTPFAMSSGDQFRPGPPPQLNSPEYAASVQQVRQLGDAASTVRTSEQTAIARFWAGAGGTSTPPGQWNQIAMDVGLEQRQTLLQNARLMALLNYALADAAIASWDAKYAYDFWRPIDAIRLADTDGNPSTVGNGNWTPLLLTPSFPAYTSGHSTFSAAAAVVLTEWFGSLPFRTRADRGISGQWPPPDDVSGLAVRSYESFAQAAAEAGMSRIYGGIHFDFDNSAGQAAGQQVGQLVMATLLQPRA